MKLFPLKIVSAIALEGVIHRAGSIVHVAEAVAKDLLRRGKAIAHTVAEVAEHLVAEDAEAEAAAKAQAEAAELEAKQKSEAEAKAKADAEAEAAASSRKRK